MYNRTGSFLIFYRHKKPEEGNKFTDRLAVFLFKEQLEKGRIKGTAPISRNCGGANVTDYLSLILKGEWNEPIQETGVGFSGFLINI